MIFRLASWRNTGRRLLAGAALGLAITGTLAAQQPGVRNYQHLFETGATSTGAASDFGPNPSDLGRPSRGWQEPAREQRLPYESRKPVFDGQDLWQTPSDFDLGRPPVTTPEPTESEKIQMRLSSRYGNPVVERFVKGTAVNRFSELYLELSRLIDARHVEPATYQVRVDRAVNNLRHAVRNPEFRRVHGLNASATQEQAFLRELDAFLATRTVRNANEALQVMNGVASIATRTLNLSAAAVAAEFVYGATEALDEYSAFTPEAPASRPSASTGLADSVVGIGVEIKPHEQGVVVLKTLRGSPAERAGVQTGDVITSVNGQNLGGRTMEFAVDQIAGPQGTPVLLNILRDGRTLQVSMRRERVRVYSVSQVQMIDPAQKIGYIKLDKFAEATMKEMEEALWGLHNQGMQSLILDLRGNPGGLLTTAIALSDLFLPAGTIVSTRGRTAEDNTREQANRSKTWKVPLVVIVDEHSASASEIFAAAIQENGRGLIVGRKSFGKGTVQTHFPLRSVTGNVKITTAHFYSPLGRPMAKAGVTPDIAVPKLADDQTVVPLASDRDVREAMRVATSEKVRELAATAGSGNLISRR
jgi:carboxyl-terminal processing protease